MAWDIKNVIDYSPNGDDIDTFSQKVKAEESVIYDRLNRVRCLDASAGLNVTDCEAYQLHIDTSTKPMTLYIRDDKNTYWIKLGYIEPSFGLNVSSIGGVQNGGGLGSISAGLYSQMPATANANDLYLATDKSKIFIYKNGNWDVFLSLDFNDLLNNNGTQFQVTATQLAKKNIVTTALQDGDGFVYEKSSDNIINKPVAVFNNNGRIVGSITGSPGQLSGINIATNAIADGEVLTYRSATNTWVNEPKGAIGSGKDLIIMNGNNTVARYNGSSQETIDLGQVLPEVNVSLPASGAGTWIEDLGQNSSGTAENARYNILNPPTGYEKYHFETNTDMVEGLGAAVDGSIQAALNTTPALNSPALNGAPTATTPADTDNSRRVATTAFVQSVLRYYAPINNPSFTGTPTAPTPAISSYGTQVATTAFVQDLVDKILQKYAPINNPIFQGAPESPTPSSNSNNDRIATTAFVQSLISGINSSLSQYAKQSDLSNYALSSKLRDYIKSADVALWYATKNELKDYAPITSPVFKGTPTAPTPGMKSDGKEIATTNFVKTCIQIVGTASKGHLYLTGHNQRDFVIQWAESNSSGKATAAVNPSGWNICYMSAFTFNANHFVVPTGGGSNWMQCKEYDATTGKLVSGGADYWYVVMMYRQY